MSLTKFWDQVAARMQQQPYYVCPALAAYKKDEFLRLLQRWTLPPAAVIVKTDCFEEAFGQDALAPFFAAAGSRVYALDISGAIVRAARSRTAGATIYWLCANVAQLPFAPASVDVIFSSSTYGYLRDTLAGLREAWQALKPGGRLIISVNNRRNYWFRASAAFFQRLGVIPFPLSRPFAADEFQELLQAAGFLVVEAEPIVHILPFCNSLQDPLGSRLLGLLRRFGRSRSRLRQRTAWFYCFCAKKPAP